MREMAEGRGKEVQQGGVCQVFRTYQWEYGGDIWAFYESSGYGAAEHWAVQYGSERDYCSTRQTRITTHNETCLSSQHKSEYGSCKVVLRVELYTDEMLARNGSTIDSKNNSKNNSKHLARPDFES